MEARIYKKNYLDTDIDITNRLNKLLESVGDETYYERFNDVYVIDFDYDKLVEFLNAKKTEVETYAVNSVSRPKSIYEYEFEYIEDSDIENADYYNNYGIAYYSDEDIENKIYRIYELKKLVEEGKFVLLYDYLREEVMDDDMFMDDAKEVYPFSSYPFPNLKSLDSKTKKLTMKIIHTLVPPERIQSDINRLSKVKKLGTIK